MIRPISMPAKPPSARQSRRATGLRRIGWYATELPPPPDDPRVWVMSATLNRARGNLERAGDDLKRARALRLQELGVDRAEADQRPTSGARRFGAGPTVFAMNGSTNPFRAGDVQTGSMNDFADSSPIPVRPMDPMLRDIETQMGAVREDRAPKFCHRPGIFVSRTGSAGLDQLTEVSLPGELVARPLGQGVLTATATPTFLSAGNVEANASGQTFFGTGLAGRPAPPSQHAEGVGLSRRLPAWRLAEGRCRAPRRSAFSNRTSWAEWRWAPSIGDNARLRVDAERRAVTDSVLSYAGTKAPGGPIVPGGPVSPDIPWGGVTRTRGHAQLEYSLREANLYAGGGYAVLDGKNVASNHEYEFGAGGTYPIWRNATDELRLGLDTVYFAYDKNLRFFTLGQGGYFSPQSYLAALFPLKYTSKT